jgi:hypothetical protein
MYVYVMYMTYFLYKPDIEQEEDFANCNVMARQRHPGCRADELEKREKGTRQIRMDNFVIGGQMKCHI